MARRSRTRAVAPGENGAGQRCRSVVLSQTPGASLMSMGTCVSGVRMCGTTTTTVRRRTARVGCKVGIQVAVLCVAVPGIAAHKSYGQPRACGQLPSTETAILVFDWPEH